MEVSTKFGSDQSPRSFKISFDVGCSAAEDDDVIYLIGNHSPMRMVDGIDLKLGEHIKDSYGKTCTKSGSDWSPRSF